MSGGARGRVSTVRGCGSTLGGQGRVALPAGAMVPTQQSPLPHPRRRSSRTRSKSPPTHQPAPHRVGFGDASESRAPEHLLGADVPGTCLGLLIPRDRPHCGPGCAQSPDRNPQGAVELSSHAAGGRPHRGGKTRGGGTAGCARSLSPSLSHKGSLRFPPFPPPAPLPPLLLLRPPPSRLPDKSPNV